MIGYMKHIIEMSLDEFLVEHQRTEWSNLPVGTVFIEKEAGGWTAYEVLGHKPRTW